MLPEFQTWDLRYTTAYTMAQANKSLVCTSFNVSYDDMFKLGLITYM